MREQGLFPREQSAFQESNLSDIKEAIERTEHELREEIMRIQKKLGNMKQHKHRSKIYSRRLPEAYEQRAEVSPSVEEHHKTTRTKHGRRHGRRHGKEHPPSSPKNEEHIPQHKYEDSQNKQTARNPRQERNTAEEVSDLNNNYEKQYPRYGENQRVELQNRALPFEEEEELPLGHDGIRNSLFEDLLQQLFDHESVHPSLGELFRGIKPAQDKSNVASSMRQPEQTKIRHSQLPDVRARPVKRNAGWYHSPPPAAVRNSSMPMFERGSASDGKPFMQGRYRGRPTANGEERRFENASRLNALEDLFQAMQSSSRVPFNVSAERNGNQAESEWKSGEEEGSSESESGLSRTPQARGFRTSEGTTEAKVNNIQQKKDEKDKQSTMEYLEEEVTPEEAKIINADVNSMTPEERKAHETVVRLFKDMKGVLHRYANLLNEKRGLEQEVRAVRELLTQELLQADEIPSVTDKVRQERRQLVHELMETLDKADALQIVHEAVGHHGAEEHENHTGKSHE